MGDLLYTILLTIFSILDSVVIFLITNCYKLLIGIADTNIFNTEVIQMFGQRIYVLLGIFMLFKLTFTFISYLISPDDLSNSDKGVGKLITNVAIVVILIVSVPWIFEQAFKIQGMILKNNVIEKLILGVGSNQYGDDVEASVRTENVIAFSIYSSFIKPNKELPTIGNSCDDIYVVRDIGYSNGSKIGCAAAIDQTGIKNSEFILFNFDKAVKEADASFLVSRDLLTTKVDGVYLFDYTIIIATLAGGLAAIILLSFCFDVAIRAVKLGFLQLIAPIPIVSYLDPKANGKDGMFRKWVSTSTKTFIDLFVRLAAVFFAVFIISIIANNFEFSYYSTGEGTSNYANTGPGILVKIFIILGALLFAKQIPQLITDITGIKMDGKFTLNPIKRINEVPMLGKSIATVGGAVAGIKAGSRVGNPFIGGLFGALSGAKSIPLSGSKDGKDAFFTGANSAYKNLMGKDFVNFSMSNLVIREKYAKDKIDEVGKPLKTAYQLLDKTQTRLNIAQHTTVELNNKLRSNGVDTSNIEEASNNLQNRKNSMANELSQAKFNVDNLKNQLMSRPNDENLKKQFEQESNKYSNLNQEYNNIESVIKDIDSYKESIENETKMRNEISKINKDIKDMSGEKGQREKFYRYDPSPSKDVKETTKKYIDIGKKEKKELENKKELG